MTELTWHTKRKLANLISALAEEKQSSGGKALSEYGKLNADGEAYILKQQQEDRDDSVILQKMAREFMKSGERND